MKFHSSFVDIIDCANEQEVFLYLKNSFVNSINVWDYFVNWKKVLQNAKSVEIDLNLLNYLVGKDNIEDEFCFLLKEYPRIISVIPILIACRNLDFKILTDYAEVNLVYKYFDFKVTNNLTEDQVNRILEFVRHTGLLDLFKNKVIKSIPDYVLGIEVGLDSNARKNRSGTIMETIVYNILQQICQEHKLLLITQATSSKIYQQWGILVKVDKSSRRFDFAVKHQEILYLIETNFYGGGGSKLKATAGEYKSLYDFIASQKHRFIWITDGFGWQSALRPLEETFNHIDYILNLKMITSGLLTSIILQKL